jgi:hypothetical protein
MSKSVFIAEKPSVAKAFGAALRIAKAINQRGGTISRSTEAGTEPLSGALNAR